MSNTITQHDFVVLDFTGRLPSGEVFDTTVASVAKVTGLATREAGFHPVTICVGERQLLPGLDAHLLGKEYGKSYAFKLSPEEAFGKRDVKNVKIVPHSSFKEHNVMPRPGLQINIDGEVGTVKSVSGGRVIVNFNHPLAGQDVVYEVTLHRKVTDVKEQVSAFFQTSLKLSAEQIEVSDDPDKVHAKLAVAYPQPLLDMLSKKLTDLVHGKIVIVSAKSG
ncbi:peptidylprolyl isomerase [Candidatus Woesearchaeota archaeon]|nr:peptidylprolyl isomerase [Candidatus Woesearchaeota archaeon]